jgi:hypothetical protein
MERADDLIFVQDVGGEFFFTDKPHLMQYQI